MAQEKYDYDYANTMLTECVANDPGNLVYVDAFFQNLFRKYQNNRRRPRSRGISKGNLKKLLAQQDWTGIIRAGLDALKSNPWDVATLRAMADACKELHLNEIELRFLKSALDGNPKDLGVNRHCAKSLARMGQYDMAIACWHRVEENKPRDKEAAEMISQLSLERNRAQAGFAEPTEQPGARTATSPSRTEPTSSDSADEVVADEGSEKTKREIPLTTRQRLDRAITDDPTNIENYLELARVLAGENRVSEAEHTLKKALSISGGEIKVHESLEDLQMQRARQQVMIAENQAKSEGTDESRELAKKIRQETIQREVEIYQARCDRYPDDPQYAYELGARLKRIGKYDDAVQALNRSLDEVQRKPAALLELGECHQHLKDYRKAMKSYTDAVEAAKTEKDPQIIKLALYRAGVLATGLKNLDEAKKHLIQLIELDPAYRDASDRLDKIREIGDKG